MDICKNASFYILKDISIAAFAKQKSLQREQLLEYHGESAAKKIWTRVKKEIEVLGSNLRRKARHKFSKVLPFYLEDLTTHHGNSVPRQRRFTRTQRRASRQRTSKTTELETRSQGDLPDLNAINLTSSDLTDEERSLLAKGPSFCPTPKDVNWQKVIDDLERFERIIRLAANNHDRDQDESFRRADSRLPPVPSTNSWMPPKSHLPEVEVFISNVKKDILDPNNLKTVHDNLSKEERSALRKFRSNDRVIRIQDKGSRFVIFSKKKL